MNRTQKKINKSKLTTVALIILCLILYIFGQSITRTNNKLQQQLNEVSTELFELREYNNKLINDIETFELTIKELQENKWRALVIATFRIETGNGTSYLWNQHSNAGGIKNYNNEYKSYDSKKDGLEALETLLQRYVDLYGYDIKKIRSIYCPVSDSGCLGDYEKFIEIYKEELWNEY